MAKLTEKQLKTLKTIYLHSDGHAVLVHEKDDKEAGRVNWVEVYETFGPKCYFKGRLIFSSFYDFKKHGLARIVANAEQVYAKETKTVKTEERGMTLHYCEITTKDGSFDLHSAPGLFSGEFTWQENNNDKWEDIKDRYSWSNCNIAKKYLDNKEVKV